MIINKYGESIEINCVTYTVGMNVAGTKESEYEGLIGRITEIRTDSDMDTENIGRIFTVHLNRLNPLKKYHGLRLYFQSFMVSQDTSETSFSIVLLWRPV